MNDAPRAWTLTRRASDAGALVFDVTISDSEAAFEGHFPGRPLLLGMAQVLLVEDALRAAIDPRIRVSEIPQAKFRAPVTPGDLLTLRIEALPAEGSYSFRLAAGRGSAVEGRVRTARDRP